jgi:hypothetical protein
MYTLQVLNDAGEWELVVQLFKTEEAAAAFFYAELGCFADYCIMAVETL